MQGILAFQGFPSWFMKLEMMSLSGMCWMKVSTTGKNRRRAETAASSCWLEVGVGHLQQP